MGVREEIKKHLTSVPQGELVQLAKAIRDDLRQSLIKDLSACLSQMEKAQEAHWNRMESFLKSLPIPQVTVQPGEVTVNQVPSQVTVNVPQQAAPVVNVEPPSIRVEAPIVNVPQQAAPVVNVENRVDPTPVNVNVPKQEASIVNVNVPEQVPPQVLFNVPKEAINLEVAVEQNLLLPKRKTSSEKLIQFDTGRQARVLETIMEENED